MFRPAVLPLAVTGIVTVGVIALGQIALPWVLVAVLAGVVAGVLVQLAVGPSPAPEVAHGREELLRAVVETAPIAVLVYGETGRIAFSNEEARRLFSEGRPLDGENFLKLLDCAPEALKQGLVRPTDAPFTVEEGGELDTFRLARRTIDLHGEEHTLLMVKELTPELGRQHYARFARLPRPRPQSVSWATFLDGLRALYPNVRIGEAPPGEGWFDPGQLQQTLINLLENAVEASQGEPDVELSVRVAGDGSATLTVADRGSGMSDEVLRNATVPFFSTKERGTGLGLALCREILEAHRGRLSLARREGGGMEVTCWLPSQGTATPPRTTR